MKTSTTQAGKVWPAIGKVVAALAVASMIGGIASTPAHGQGKGWHKGWDKGEWRGDYYQGDYRPVYREPYYSPPVYVPAPVYYYPVQSPGISLFFPLDLR